ncbi:MAG: NADH-quinone oxidoreductase subunit NuoB [Desulfovibrionaceae bacterium]|nr:NADH-quinone oxidoreductase subunit NuoB [Desulfovibrionaceae bacterium]
MFGILKERIHQKYRTLDYPAKEPFLPERYRGRPELTSVDCGQCRLCLEACPSGAIRREGADLRLDLGRCIFCGACEKACPKGAIHYTRDYKVAAFTREDLILTSSAQKLAPPKSKSERKPLFTRSLKLREVCCGGCAACEADTNVLGTLLYDLGRFGIDFVASPRHADGILVTGPVTQNMAQALFDTYRAVPDPRIVIAVGSCAISGGLFAESPECLGGIPKEIPVDLYVPGCPPNPWSILSGLLALQKIR